MRAFNKSDLVIDTNQGRDKKHRSFGYVHTGEPRFGGYFFTWMTTLEETLESLDPDVIDEPRFAKTLAREFLENKIAKRWTTETE
jgi:hypothetical protein